MAMSMKQLCVLFTLSSRTHSRSLPGALLSCADKKVSKETAEDLSYGPQPPQTAKRGSNQAFSRSGLYPGCPLWKPLGNATEKVLKTVFAREAYAVGRSYSRVDALREE